MGKKGLIEGEMFLARSFSVAWAWGKGGASLFFFSFFLLSCLLLDIFFFTLYPPPGCAYLVIFSVFCLCYEMRQDQCNAMDFIWLKLLFSERVC